LLWFDLLVRATGRVGSVTTLANRVTCDVTAQNLGFWHFLDTEVGADPDLYADKDGPWVAEQYLRYHAERFAAPPEVLEALRRRVEDEFWVHPASRRVLDLWGAQCELLGLERQALETWMPLSLTVDDVIDALADAGLALDTRAMGAGVYLDLTDHGVALRQLVNEHGVPNYVVHVLRELLAAGPKYDKVLFGIDMEARHDFDLIRRVLERFGVESISVPVDRVPLPGVTGTTRTGGWEDYTLERIIDRFVPQYGVPAFRLGMRMYYVLHVGRRGRSAFDLDMLERFIRRAAGAIRQLDPGESNGAASGEFLRTLWHETLARDGVYIDPNRLLQALLKAAPESVGARVLVRELLI
jgi:hypothetical protein